MGLYQILGNDLKQSMKTGDTFRRDTLRLLQSALKNFSIEKRKEGSALSEAEIEGVIRKLAKQRKESIVQYTAGNRGDLVAQEEQELQILTAYLPEAMPASELKSLVERTLKESNLTTKDKMGQAMGEAMKRVAGRASGDEVRRIVEEFLS